MPLNCPKYIARHGEGRSEARIACQIPCVIEPHKRPSQRVDLVSLSPSGGRIRRHFGLMPNDALVLRIGTSASVQATVVWVLGELAGLKLKHPLRLPCCLLSTHCLRAIAANAGEPLDHAGLTPEICTNLFKTNGLPVQPPSEDWVSANRAAGTTPAATPPTGHSDRGRLSG